MNTQMPAVVQARELVKVFPGSPLGPALDQVSLSITSGRLTALVGPDGAGKTTLLRLMAGLMKANSGTLEILGLNVATQPQAVQDRISYMPQRFGLYEDLSVQENLDLYADLHGVPSALRNERFAHLLQMTDLTHFTERPAGKLSGGMKQKLGLACTLVRSPDLLLLDEPTVGVDPLSRRELWEIVQRLVDEEKLSVIISTAYMDEAQRCAHIFVMYQGRLLAQGSPEDLCEPARERCFVATPALGTPARTLQAKLLDDSENIIDAVPEAGQVRFIQSPQADPARLATLLTGVAYHRVPVRLEDGVQTLLRQQRPAETLILDEAAASAIGETRPPMIEVRDLVRRFGDFTAVASTSFSVQRGEIFGLLGPNGAGKTTTFRMLCGLLPASSGHLEVAGVNLRTARATARRKVGYVSQKFALYGNLTVSENLTFFGGAYGLSGTALRERMDAVLGQFDLRDQLQMRSGELPGGYQQRLAMAVALLHEPEILFLDEPTSGIDPLARRSFWRRITALAQAGTTIIVTTHFMEEAEYCDRILIQDAGRVLALGTPAEVRQQAGGMRDMNSAFIGIVEQARAQQQPQATPVAAAPAPAAAMTTAKTVAHGGFWRRLASLTRKEFRQLLRDRSNLAIGVVLPIVLILIFGYGISLDIENAPVAVVLEDASSTAREVVAGLGGSPYLAPIWVNTMPAAERLMRERRVDGIVRVPADFSRRLVRGDAQLQLLLHGTDANSASTLRGYVNSAIGQWSQRQADRNGRLGPMPGVALAERLWFNAANTSTWYLVPGLIALIMTLVGAFLTALVVAREWERGTLEALFVTPVRSLEILLAKMIPYFMVGMLGLSLCLAAARLLFHVPIQGSLIVLLISSTLYMLVALGIGLVISAKTRNQFLASQVAVLTTFLPALMLSGFLFDLRNVPAAIQVIGTILPATYFVELLKTLFLAGNNWPLIVRDWAVLAGYAVLLLGAARLMTRKTLD